MTSTPFTVWSGSDLATLASSFLGAGSGISIDASSISLNASGADAVNLYDGSLTALGIGAGLLLTSGTTPGTTNTVGWFGQDNTQYAPDGTPINFNNGNALIDSVVNTVFQTQSYDATTLSFNFTVSDPAATSITFDLVFGSDEYPEWVDQFVDCAVIVVNGVNYALFNHDPNAPLSVIGSNLAAGYFQDNAGNILPIEYDGVSHVLKIVAPINGGQVNSITIGIADTGDHVYDSGLFIANMVAGTTPGSGVVITPDVPATDGSDTVSGTVGADLIDLKGGDDTAYAGAGDDIVLAGAGNDHVYGGSGNDTLEGDQGNDVLDGGDGSANVAVYAGSSADFTVTVNGVTGQVTVTDRGSDANDEGSDTLINIQQLKFADGLFDVTPGGLVAHVDSSGAANAPGAVALSGIAVPGHVLTAIVTDADGLPASAAITFQWLTSVDGVTWTDTGAVGQTFTLAETDAGHQVMAIASYTDPKGAGELVQSGALAVAAPSGGLMIQLMTLDTPAGGAVANPITTLLADAVALGFTPASAEQAIKVALGLPDVDLRTYDAYAALQANPTDPTALAVMKIGAQVAMLASVSDPGGFDLTLKVIAAFDGGQVLNLADKTTIETLLAGTDAALLQIIEGLNKDMADAHSLSGATLVWNDYAGQTDQLSPYIGHLDVLSIAINQAPTGFFDGALPHAAQDQPLTIATADLLAGFTDPEGAALSVSGLAANVGGAFVDNGDGTFTFVPDAGYVGPVELSWTVSDPAGASIGGQGLLIVDAALPPADTTPPTATLTSDVVGTANGVVSFTLTFSEPVTALDASAFTVANGAIASVVGDGTVFTVQVTPAADFEGVLDLTLNAGAVTDLAGNATQVDVAASQAIDTLAPSATIASTVTGTVTGSVTYTLSFSEAVTGLAVDDFTVTNGQVSAVSGSGTTWTVTVTPGADIEGVLGLALNNGAVIDAAGNAGNGAAAATLALDTRAPTVAGFTPADGATGVDVGASLVVTFSEAVVHGSGTITIRAGSATGTVVESFDAATSARLGWAGTTLTIDPTAALAAGTHYFVTFTAGSVTDLAGNAYAGSATYDFTTLAPQPLVLVGTAGVDVLTGGDLNDVLTGLGGVDKLDGKGGSDSYVIGAASEHSAAEITDTGTSGTDTVTFAATTASTLTLFAGDTGIDAVTLAAGTVGLSVNAGAVKNGLAITGNAGANTLTGTGFDDVLTGGAGNDVLAGGAGNDTASYADMSASVTVNLTLTKAQATGAGGSDTLTGIENLIGGAGNDVLTGNASVNRLEGGAGNDTFDGGAGADRLTGGAGSDTFLFTATSSTAAAADTITDFNRGEGDRIDLHLIDAVIGGKDNAFTVVSALSHAAGQLAVSVSGDHYLVQGDVNGDGLADFGLIVYAATPLGAADFVL